MVKLWNVEASKEPSCVSTVSIPSRRVDVVTFHPTADQIVTTLGNEGKKVCIWDAHKSDKAALEIASPSEPFHSFSWKSDGSLLSTSGKGVVTVWDPRAAEQISTGAGHEGIKGSRVVWLGETNYLFTVGQSKFRSREYGLWDSRNLASPVKKASLDQSTGIMLPLYDEDTETVYLIGRGDASIRSMQMSDLITRPSIDENMACGTVASVYGAALVPKQSLHVMQAEIARVLAVVENAIMPVSFEVPRKQYLDFHADLFPETKGTVPGLSAPEWLAGENKPVAKVSLDPAKAKSIPTTANTNGSQPAAITKDVMQNSPAAAPAAAAATAISTPPSSSTSTASENPSSASVKEQEKSSPSTTTEEKQSADAQGTEPKEEQEATAPKPKKKLPQYGSAHASAFKYVSGKLYHPSTHYDDLRGLSIDKSGNFDLIQASTKLIGVPISGAGGRVGIISINKPGRLPTQIPSILCGSTVTNFKFDPFDPHVLATASEDNCIRLWRIPEDGLEEDTGEPFMTLKDPSMDKTSQIEFHPITNNVLLSVSNDLGKPSIRIWDLDTQEVKFKYPAGSNNGVLYCAWSTDGKKVAIHGKDKQLHVLDARSGDVLGQTKSHDGIRPSRIVWLDAHRVASVGFGLGSMREILVFDIDKLEKPVLKKSIDVSPSVMSVYYDPDCDLLYVAGRGDRIIHTYAAKELEPLAKIEGTTLQQGLVFLPKRLCHVKETEIARFYRLTPTSIEPYGVRVPRARPEYFQDDIFIDTPDYEHPAQDAKSWFDGEDTELKRVSLQPEGMTPLSEAPPPPQAARSKAKFEMGKKMVSDEERRQNLMNRMFSTAKRVDEEEEERLQKEQEQNKVAEEEKDVADDEWDD
ncbi:hypothetical protein BDB00DRAFT_117680 [Zychaea mexicana]|uniref:uncharacterized protein n=1 Tax=Zychaea mexicana TaxID=64656 RepID=UPI0022FEA131|nr:uncharacterized protein BDB00DRAFT_117680 [Zychaea mexicana]KAI9496400.1 hypothetical protein BDB00DRAFT_117680 [Zychaea mexicana]